MLALKQTIKDISKAKKITQLEMVFIDKNADIKNGEKFIISGQE